MEKIKAGGGKIDIMTDLKNCAIFENGQKKLARQNVAVMDGKVVVMNGITGAVAAEYTIVEVAKEGMAWDVTNDKGVLLRVAAQLGCGCGGQKPYQEDDSYTGKLTTRG